MYVRKCFFCVGIAAIALLAAPRQASADWTLTPFVGWNFGSSAEVSGGSAGSRFSDKFEKKIDYVVGHAPYSLNARGQIIGDSFGYLKLLFTREDMKLVGVHAIGEQATELVHIGLIAMLAGCKAEIFNTACFNYPTLGELYKYATYSAFVKRGGERVLTSGMTPSPKRVGTAE